jgi:serine protease
MIVYDNALINASNEAETIGGRDSAASNALESARRHVAEILSDETSAKAATTSNRAPVPSPNIRRVNQWLEVATIAPSLTRSRKALVDDLKSVAGVVGVIPDHRIKPFLVANDQYTDLQWHYYDPVGGINLQQAWDVALDGDFNNTLPLVNVAVIDSGILPHEDLDGQIIAGADFITLPEIARDGDGRDTDPTDTGDYMPANFCAPNVPPVAIPSSWHGTVISGLIGASVNNSLGVAGVAPNAKIIPIRVLGPCGGSLLDALEGMLWAAGATINGLPDNPNPAAIVNLSFGVEGATCTPDIQAFISGVTDLGAILVAATGNSAIDTANVIPASCDNVIAVGAASSTGNSANYSNLGAAVDLLAPGASPQNPADPDLGILSTSNNGPEGPNADDYIRGYAGTSMAAPHVSGVIAMMLGLDPSLTPAEVEQILKDTAKPFPGACNGCGAGRLDAEAAVRQAKGAGISALMGLSLLALYLFRTTTMVHGRMVHGRRYRSAR